MSSERVSKAWATRVRSEHASAATAARVLHLLILAGAPPDLIDAAHQVVADELAHSRSCHEVLVELGGGESAVEFRPTVPPPLTSPDAILPLLTADLLRGFCFGETLAAPLFAEMEKHAAGTARTVLGVIVTDEARHARFGWRALDWLLESVGPPLVRAITELLPALVSDFNSQYLRPGTEDLGPAQLRAGLIPKQDFRRVFVRTVTETILPRLAARGVDVSAARAAIDGSL